MIVIGCCKLRETHVVKAKVDGAVGTTGTRPHKKWVGIWHPVRPASDGF